MSLWKKAVTGEMLKNAGGALIECATCPCVTASCPTDCILCTHTYTLTISGLTGGCTFFNGTYPLYHVLTASPGGCLWGSGNMGIGFWAISCFSSPMTPPDNNWHLKAVPCGVTVSVATIGAGPCPPYPTSGTGTMCSGFGNCPGQSFSWSLT